MSTVIEVRNLRKIYQVGDIEVHALRKVDFAIESGGFTAIMGASGSGKSTLMNMLGCLDQPTTGEYLLDDVNVSSLTPDERADIRNQKIGFVFQGFNLLSRTTALENVELPLVYDRHQRIKNAHTAASEALERVGLSDRMHHVPSQLSGGQQQRVAIARALVNKPSILLADEPTGNLDSKTSMDIFSLFQQLNNEGLTVVMVTHERDFTLYAKRILEMRDGVLHKDTLITKRRDAAADLKNFMANQRMEDDQ
jgi:putative ABC transport system ATP-binding protein